jgi:hypothetical protein
MTKQTTLGHIGAPEHQMYVRALMLGIEAKIRRSPSLRGSMVTPETQIINKALQNQPCPDVVVWGSHRISGSPLVVIEICKSASGQKGDIAQVQTIVEAVRSTEEGFVYNFVTDAWFRVSKSILEPTQTSVSSVVKMDLRKCWEYLEY